MSYLNDFATVLGWAVIASVAAWGAFLVLVGASEQTKALWLDIRWAIFKRRHHIEVPDEMRVP